MIPDRWLVLEVRVSGDPDPGEELVADLLVGLGGRAVEEWAGGYRTHLPPPDDPAGLADEVRRRLTSLPGVRDADVTWRWQLHEEWAEAWKRGLRTRRITDRLVVAPSWAGDAAPDDLVIRIDPGVAFGTAEHATTRTCLRLLDGAVEPGDRVADLGAGSGILSVAAALLGAAGVVAVEADAVACGVARENARRNGVADRVRVVEARVGDATPTGLLGLDGVVANIETGVLLALLPAAAGALSDGGWLILAGIQDVADERDRMLESARAEGLRLDREEREEGWWSARFVRGDRS